MKMHRPIVVLDSAQLGENIGMSARAMGNCGLHTLRLSQPRANWDREKASAAAKAAAGIVDNVTVYDDLPSALADCTTVYATSARRRHMSVRVIDPETAVNEILQTSGQVALLFGAESSGLDNEAISLADAVIEIPLNLECTSLNLSQAVLLVAYSWWSRVVQQENIPAADQPIPASREDTMYLLSRLDGLLSETGFFADSNLKPVLWRNVQAMVHRSGFTAQEIQTWHGIFSALTKR